MCATQLSSHSPHWLFYFHVSELHYVKLQMQLLTATLPLFQVLGSHAGPAATILDSQGENVSLAAESSTGPDCPRLFPFPYENQDFYFRHN